MIGWFVVTTDDRFVRLSVAPPGRSPWQAVIPWDSVVRVCLEAAGFLASDDLYIFTSLRPESWLIPVEADGGQELLGELIRRGLFDAGLAITAARARAPGHAADVDPGDLTAWKAAAGRFRRTGLWLGRWRTCQTCGRVLLPDTDAENCQEHPQGQPS